MKRHWNIVVTGKVQGVYYRATTKAVADQLGIKGFVVNNPDGSVYMEAEGSLALLDSFKEWCEEGPERSEVASVSVEEAPMVGFLNFEVIKKIK